LTRHNKSLDASGGSVIRKMIGPAMVASNRAAASTQPLDWLLVFGENMMIRTTRVAQLVLILLVIPAWALSQSAEELKIKYGPPFKAYEIRPGIMMTVKFGQSGQASELRIERHVATESTIYIDSNIPSYVVKEIVDELVPESERGPKGKYFGLTLLIGGGATTSEDYENVSIIYEANQSQKGCSGIVAIVIKWKERPRRSEGP